MLVERASAIEAARAGRGGPLPRCELIEGDFFQSVPPGGDVYVLKRVLVDHTDEKDRYLTSGENDLVVFVETPNGDNVAKLALALGSLGNVRTRTCRVWPFEEY